MLTAKIERFFVESFQRNSFFRNISDSYFGCIVLACPVCYEKRIEYFVIYTQICTLCIYMHILHMMNDIFITTLLIFLQSKPKSFVFAVSIGSFEMNFLTSSVREPLTMELHILYFCYLLNFSAFRNCEPRRCGPSIFLQQQILFRFLAS